MKNKEKEAKVPKNDVKNSGAQAVQAKAVSGKFAALEEEVLKRWSELGIFKKTLAKESPLGEYVFYDGPPFASGQPHYGHILAGTIKDAIPRFKTMQGFHVPRRWGWDCHGLPVENLVEKELGLKGKKDIEDLGIEKFNAAAKESVMRFADDWRKVVPRMGRFVDMDDDYRTMDSSYTESVWWAFKALREKGLLYEGFKSMHICPHCETTLSNFEVTQGYQDIKDISVYVKFELSDEPGTYFLAWTTTPWTLPGNVALAVNPDIEYVAVSHTDESGKTAKIIVSKAAAARLGLPVGTSYAGTSLVGKAYKALFPYYANDKKLQNRENGWKVYPAEFVTTEDGTGIVHIAPAFGEDDLNLGNAKKLPFVQHVGMDGRFKDEVKDFAGESVKPKGHHIDTDKKVIEYLKAHGTLFKEEPITHSYPHCWRCDTPLLNYAASSWFVKVTDIKDKLVEENKGVDWVPSEIRDGRFGKWLEGARDWAISRSRYWGAPIPVWRCGKCKEQATIGSIADLAARLPRRNRFIVMRHGEAENNTQDIVSSGVENPHHLTKKGEKEVADSAERLVGEKIDLIVSSPLLRTRETAEIVRSALGLSEHAVEFDKRLREVEGGEFDKKPFEEYHDYFKRNGDRFVTRPPGGECYVDVRRRVMAALYDIDARHEGKTILIVTHESPVWLLLAGTAGLDRRGATRLRETTGRVFVKNAEFRELPFVRLPKNADYETDLHRPFIDDIDFPCECGGVMQRVSDVFDCWFESGSMPYAQSCYLGSPAPTFDPAKEAGFPADFIAEGLDQTRGWFYSLIVLSVALFGKTPYRRVIVNGLVLAENGQKMSKRLKNYPDPMEVVGKYGADALRLFLLGSPVVHGEDLRFSERGVDEIMKKTLLRLDNVLAFYRLQAPEGAREGAARPESENVLDHWAMTRLSQVVAEVTAATENGELDRAVRPLHAFVDDLSTWYVRRSRDRFKSENLADRAAALATLHYLLSEFGKALAPFAPFYADYLYRAVMAEAGKESVHLESWPETSPQTETEKTLLSEMAEVREEISRGLELRAKANIKVRQPLASYETGSKVSALPAYAPLVAEELNVKEVRYGKERRLDTDITPELKREGDLRDLVRAIQDLRKKVGLSPKDKVALLIETDDAGRAFIGQVGEDLAKNVGVRKFEWKKPENGTEVRAGEHVFTVEIEK